MGLKTRQVKVGKLLVGGVAPVSVQTMCNVDPHDAKACLDQLLSCAALGCDVFRMTVPDLEAAKVLGEVKKGSPIPIVADIHFDYRCALAAIEAGTFEDLFIGDYWTIGGVTYRIAAFDSTRGTSVRAIAFRPWRGRRRRRACRFVSG